MTAAKLAVNDFDSPGGPRLEAKITELEAPDSSSDRRRAHARCGVDLEVSLGSEHNFYAGLAENISAGGVFVATHMVKPVGELVELTIHFPEEDRVVRYAAATCGWHGTCSNRDGPAKSAGIV
jgi:hypothetical protein